jgi:N12 class adenine-specific DNA methylase
MAQGRALERHHDQQNHQICEAENHHGFNFGEKQRTASRDHVQNRDRRIIRRLIDVHDAVSAHVDF